MALLLILAGGAWTLAATRSDPASPPEPSPTIETVGQVSTPAPTTEADTLPIGTEPGQRAPGFALDDLEDRTHHLVDYRGQVIILDFWATWCGFCREQLPILQAVSDKYAGQGVTVLALNQEESAAKVAAYRDQSGISLTMLLDTHGRVANDYAVPGLPTLYFIDRDGLVHSKKIGLTEQAEVEAEVEALLAQAASP